MAALPATERSHPDSLGEPRDGSYRYPTDAEMTEAICYALGIHPDELRDGRRLRRVNHVIELVRLYHREARATGQDRGLKKRAAAAAALWPHVDRERQKNSMWRWEAIAEQAGLLRVRDGRGARALQWELLSEWQRYTGAPRGCSSVGSTVSCEVRRRRETRSERHGLRVRPWCRRVGNKTGSAGRLLAPLTSSKRPGKLSLWGSVEPPTGDPTELWPTRAGAAGCGKPLVDATEPPGGPSAGAAPDRNSGSGPERVGLRAERLFESAFGPPAGGPLRDPGPLEAAVARLGRFADEFAELNGWQPAPDRGLTYFAELVEREAAARRGEGRPPPRHLGWFVPRVVAEARRLERKARSRRQPLQRRQRALEAVELVERLRAVDPARGGRGSPPPHLRGSGDRRT